MYLEQLLDIYVKELDIQFATNSQNELRNSPEFKKISQEFNSIIKFAMSQDKNNTFAENIFADIEEYNNTHQNQKINLADNKRAEFLNPGISKTANYRLFFKNALLKDKDIIANFDANIAKSGLKLDFLKDYELNQRYQEALKKSNAREDRSKQLLGNTDTDFLNSGSENLSKEDRKRLARQQTIGHKIRYYEEEDIPDDADLIKDTKDAMNLIFNKTPEKPEGDGFTAENINLAITAISNLKANHNQRSNWVKFWGFFGFYGNVGKELSEANRLIDGLVAKGLPRDLVEQAVDAKDMNRKAALIDSIKEQQGIKDEEIEIEKIDIPRNNPKEYEVQKDKEAEKLVEKDFDFLKDNEGIDKAFEDDDYLKDKDDFELDKIDDNFDLEDEKEKAYNKMVVTFNPKESKNIDDYDIEDIGSKGYYTKEEVRYYKNQIKNMQRDMVKSDEEHEIEVNNKMTAEFNVLLGNQEISEIKKPRDTKMLHELIEKDINGEKEEVTEIKEFKNEPVIEKKLEH